MLLTFHIFVLLYGISMAVCLDLSVLQQSDCGQSLTIGENCGSLSSNPTLRCQVPYFCDVGNRTATFEDEIPVGNGTCQPLVVAKVPERTTLYFPLLTFSQIAL